MIFPIRAIIKKISLTNDERNEIHFTFISGKSPDGFQRYPLRSNVFIIDIAVRANIR